MKKTRCTALAICLLSFSLFAQLDTNRIAFGIFSNCLEHSLPCGWEKFKAIKGVSLQRDSTGYFIHMASFADVEGIGKRKEFNVRAFPLLHWRWRVHVLPADACENIKKKNDSAAGLYIAFNGMFPFNHVIKYAWSTSLPVGTITKSPHHGKTRVFIIRSGPDSLNRWISEERNVYNDYRLAFGGEPPTAEGIAIQTDSDNTRTSASADFADIFISKNQ